MPFVYEGQRLYRFTVTVLNILNVITSGGTGEGEKTSKRIVRIVKKLLKFYGNKTQSSPFRSLEIYLVLRKPGFLRLSRA